MVIVVNTCVEKSYLFGQNSLVDKPIVRTKRSLSDKELGLSHRLREIRNRLNLSQSEAAKQLGVSRERLASYEDGRAPIRFEFALRFCWQLVVSEEWLALGEKEIVTRLDKGSTIKHVWYSSMARMCMSLLCEQVCHKIKPGTSFLLAYDTYLDSVYQRLRIKELHPRILFTEATNEDQLRNLMHAFLERWMQFLETPLQKIRFLRSLAFSAQLMQMAISGGELTEFERDDIISRAVDAGGISDSVLGDVLKEDDFIKKQKQKYLDSYGVHFGPPPPSSKNKDLTETATSGMLTDVKAQLPELVKRLNRATEQTGKMSALAEFLEVPLASVSRWLSGKREPGGEITLKMLHWVQDQERQK